MSIFPSKLLKFVLIRLSNILLAFSRFFAVSFFLSLQRVLPKILTLSCIIFLKDSGSLGKRCPIAKACVFSLLIFASDARLCLSKIEEISLISFGVLMIIVMSSA